MTVKLNHPVLMKMLDESIATHLRSRQQSTYARHASFLIFLFEAMYRNLHKQAELVKQ